jgi:hypothetical protein
VLLVLLLLLLLVLVLLLLLLVVVVPSRAPGVQLPPGCAAGRSPG